MAVDREDNDGVRLHVGGLARGVDPKDLEALLARALPAGAKPRAEIMRDATTGIERGFGYVSVPGGEGVGAAARRAIVAYNGTRWKGNKLKVSIAKGDYMQRLKGEWEEAATAAAAVAALRKGVTLREGRGEEKDHVSSSTEGVGVGAGAGAGAGHAAYKARPSLRLRRRPGERIILVDPTPIAWVKPQRPLAGWQKEKEEKKQAAAAAAAAVGGGVGGKGGGQGEGGEERVPEPHRRKRGVLGCRQRLVFPGREATCSTKCRDLWRRHLQEKAAEASAAKLRSVERLISGKGPSAAVTTSDDEGRKARKRERRAAKLLRAAESLPVEDSGEAGLAPEEPPPAEGIEFVWDDGDAGEQREQSGSEAFSEEEAQEDAAGNGWQKEEAEEEEDEEEEEQEEEDEEAGEDYEDDGEEEDEEDEEDEEEDEEGEDKEGGRSSRRQDGGRLDGKGGGDQHSTPTLIMPVVAKELGKSEVAVVAAAAMAEREAARRRRRLADKHGLELDDRLAELLSDGSADEDDEGYDDNGDATGGGTGYDYELETARRAEAAGGGGKDKEAVAAAGGGGGVKETPEGMRDRLQAETERSLSVLAAMFGGSVGGGGGDGSGGGATRTTPSVEGKQPSTAEKSHEEGLKDDKKKSGDEEEERVEGNQAEKEEEEGEEKHDEEEGRLAVVDQQRFMAHIPKLTDIFKVQDKVSTKKNKEEKDKDKSFKVASLFGSRGGVASAGAGAGAASTGGGFSFSFGGGDGGGGGGDGDGGKGGGVINPGWRGVTETAAAAGANLTASPATAVGSTAGANAVAGDSAATAAAATVSSAGQESGSDASHEAGTMLWRPLSEVVAVGARFLRVGTREDVEAAWLGDRRALTQDFKRKHKDAVKGRRGGSGRGGGASKRRRT